MRKYLIDDLEINKNHFWHKSKQLIVIKIIERYSSKKKGLLDVGCGNGQMLVHLNDYKKTWGIDISARAIKICAKKGINNVKKGSIYRIPFNNNYFDTILLLDILEHTKPQHALREISRVLKRNGIIIITVPAYKILWSKWDEIHKHKKRYKAEVLIHELNDAGFSVKYISYFFSYLVIPVYIYRKIKYFLPQKAYSSDFEINNRLLNFFSSIMSTIEMYLISKTNIPFGTSIICVAEKRQTNLKTTISD